MTDIAPAETPHVPLLARITDFQWTCVDAVVGLVLLLGSLGDLLIAQRQQPGSLALAAALLAVASLATPLRRRSATASLVTAAAAAAALVMLVQPFAPLPFIAFPLYSFVTTHRRGASVLALFLVGISILVAVAVAAVRPADRGATVSLLLLVVVWFVADAIRNRREYAAELVERAARAHRDDIEGARRTVVEERLQIARELHDVVAHSLSVIAVQSAVGRRLMDRKPEAARQALSAVESTSRDALDELRSMLGALRRDGEGPDRSPAPTIDQLDTLVAHMAAIGLPVELRRHGAVTALAPALELSVYRIVQEALTNVVKHARASSVSVDITYGSDAVTVRVVNDGLLGAPVAVTAMVGVAAERDASSGLPSSSAGDHHGIVGMQERAALFGGWVSAGAVGERFCVEARLLLAAA